MRIHCSVEHCTEVGDCSADGQLGLGDMNFTYNVVLTFLPPSGDLPERMAVPSSHQTNHPRLNPRMPPQTEAPSTSKELRTSAKALLTTSSSSTQTQQNINTLSNALKALQETLDFPSIQLNVSP